MNNSQLNQVGNILMLISVLSCGEVTPPVSQDVLFRPITYSVPQQIPDLAGTWEYKDEAGQGTITLDAEGSGAYEWEDGRFETRSLKNGVWKGVWFQERNDREGEFKLTFSHDSSVAQGTWWYTRIGKDKDPLEPGGTFSMSRSSSGKIAE